MAKKKKIEEVATIEVTPIDENSVVRSGYSETVVTSVSTTDDMGVLCCNCYKPRVEDINIKELVAYEEACRMICTHYDREMKLNELEKRNYTPDQIRNNREKYNKYVSIHTKVRELIENKINKLTEYENW